MVTPLHVVFDTNAFRPDTFDFLEHSPMRKLCRAGRIVPIYGHVFLEETLRAYGIEKKREDLIQKWLPFIKDTHDRICDDFVDLWHRELVQGKGIKTNIFMSRRAQDMFLSELSSIPLDGSWSVWHESENDRDVESAKRDTQRKISMDMRKTAEEWRRKKNYDPKKHGVSRFEQFYESEVDSVGRELLMSMVRCKDPDALANRWARSKSQYPYFTTFVKNVLYMAHYAMTNCNGKVDGNAHADLDLMTHLLHANILVTNEAGFLRQAFEELWRPKGKVAFTSQQFADFIRKL